MTEGNKRYLGDVWINEENLDRQREFFKSIIDSFQYKNGGSFDAETLQGYTPENFATAEQGEIAQNAFQKPLRLGKTLVNDNGAGQYIQTDAIFLDNESECIQNLPFYSNGMDLTNGLCSLYTDTQTKLGNKLDVSTYNNFYNNEFLRIYDSISDVFEVFTDNNGDNVTKLNASLVNGLRFILITQDDYDNLSADEKSYWRNVYIIKEYGEIPPDYVDPMTWELSDGYDFRIYDKKLQVNNGLTDEWKTICNLDDFVLGTDLEDVVIDIMSGQTVNLNEDSLLDALIDISASDIEEQWRQYPFISSELRNDFVYDIKINNSSTNVTSTVDNETNLKTVNLDMNTVLTPINSSLSEKADAISAIEQQLPGIASRLSAVEGINDQQEQTISDITNQLSQIGTNNSNIVDLIYPVGSIYMSVNTTNPSTLFGGSWTKIEGRFLLASSSTYASGSTGGAATVTLTAAQSGLKEHTHGMAHTHKHRHQLDQHFEQSGTSTTSDAYHVSSNLKTKTFYTQYDSTTSSKSATDKNIASNATQAHNNMPPYLAVNVWQRVS